MSASSPPPDVHYDEDEHYHASSTPTLSPPASQITRTVAIIKTHALPHRFDIEPRIQAASFEIVKERQMEFDTETDPDTLFELFGEDAASLAEGPVWVYVLERRRAVEVWNALMGNRDPAIAREEAPTSLRALYGISREQNGLMGSADNTIAEIQIASLFVSSPPFPLSDLPDDQYGSVRSVSSSVLNGLRRSFSNEGYAPSSATNPSTSGGGGKLNVNGKPLFRARPLPATTIAPDIVPRTTRAAALRAGTVVVEKKGTMTTATTSPRAPLSKERLQKTFENVPGHKRAEVIQVASTAAPVIAPRMTRAAALRLGQQPEPAAASRRKTLGGEEAVRDVFEGVPGHKRRESFTVASVKAPTVAPRLNKSAALRASKDQAPPSSFQFKPPVAPKLPGGIARNNSQDSTSSPPRSVPPRPASAQSSSRPYNTSRPASAAGTRPSLAPRASISRPAPASASSASTTGVASPTSSSSAAGPSASAPQLKPRRSSISAPSIPPRTNRSAALRAAKQEAENEAAAAAAARKTPRRVPPSSFKTIMT